MSIFDSDWKKLHKKVTRKYELIALRNFEKDPSVESADVMGIIAEIINERIPQLSSEKAMEFVNNEYELFKHFDVLETLESELRKRNPEIPDEGIQQIFKSVRSNFIIMRENTSISYSLSFRD